MVIALAHKVRSQADHKNSQAHQHELVVRACRLLDAADAPIALKSLAASLDISPWHFHRLFRARLGVTPKDYASALQAHRVQGALHHGDSVTEAAFYAGFDSLGRFYARAQSMLGMAPSTYRAGGAGVIIARSIVETGLGPLQVAATSGGVCSVQFGDSPAALEAELRERFPAATLEAGDSRFQHTVDVLVGLVEGDAGAASHSAVLPLDIQGTAFQIRVWQALRGIPRGLPTSYAEVARSMGRPAAHRAVANACGSNPCALIIPCHRVVRADGSAGGYRWGEARKRQLLDRESRPPRQP